MMAITSNGSLVPVIPSAHRRATPVQNDSMAAAHAKDRVASYKMQSREPYYLGNAFSDYEGQAGH